MCGGRSGCLLAGVWLPLEGGGHAVFTFPGLLAVDGGGLFETGGLVGATGLGGGAVGKTGLGGGAVGTTGLAGGGGLADGVGPLTGLEEIGGFIGSCFFTGGGGGRLEVTTRGSDFTLELYGGGGAEGAPLDWPLDWPLD